MGEISLTVDTVVIDDVPISMSIPFSELSVVDTDNNIGFPVSFNNDCAVEITAKTKLSKDGYLIITGMKDILLNYCPNRRVKHLARFGKSKIKKKNINRIIRIAKKEAKNERLST